MLILQRNNQIFSYRGTISYKYIRFNCNRSIPTFYNMVGTPKWKKRRFSILFLAGRSMPWWVVGLSLFAASISSTTLIGQSGDAYHTGLAVFNYNLTGIAVMVFLQSAYFRYTLNPKSLQSRNFLKEDLTNAPATTFPLYA